MFRMKSNAVNKTIRITIIAQRENELKSCEELKKSLESCQIEKDKMMKDLYAEIQKGKKAREDYDSRAREIFIQMEEKASTKMVEFSIFTMKNEVNERFEMRLKESNESKEMEINEIRKRCDIKISDNMKLYQEELSIVLL